jgi:hypothetical protein
MDRALRLDDLLDALGTHQRRLRPPDVPDDTGEEPELEEDWLNTGPQEPVLPTGEELQDLLARTEVRLFLNQRDIPDSLLLTGWFLHGVASADTAFERYTAVRQRRAFAISAHIFDLATAVSNTQCIT